MVRYVTPFFISSFLAINLKNFLLGLAPSQTNAITYIIIIKHTCIYLKSKTNQKLYLEVNSFQSAHSLPHYPVQLVSCYPCYNGVPCIVKKILMRIDLQTSRRKLGIWKLHLYEQSPNHQSQHVCGNGFTWVLDISSQFPL